MRKARRHSMKRKILSIAIVIGLLLSFTAIPVQAATEDEIEESIEKGIEWLVTLQNVDGSWGVFEQVALTGLVVVKLEDRAYELGYSPFDPEYEYAENVHMGLNYIFSDAALHPEGGVCFAMGGHETYNTGIAMMAIAASRTPGRIVTAPGPVNGWTYEEVLHNNVKFLVNTQNPDGGWRYFAGSEPSDNSNTGYAVLGLRYAEVFGIEIPQGLKDNLEGFIEYIQCDPVDPMYNPVNDGGSGYDWPCDWVNILKTGNLLFEMEFVGWNLGHERVQRAIDYMVRHWGDMNSDPGWHDHNQATYCAMKGLEAYVLEEIDDIDWFDEFSAEIVSRQEADGSWSVDPWGGKILSTAWALLTLERVVPPLPVPVDVKPTSCPNPLNVGSKGVLPVAILGIEDFDITRIDPASVRLEGVAPLRWAYEDVATPVEPYLGKEDPYGCSEEGADGYMDLTLKFKTQELVSMLGDVEDGDVLILQLTGSLMDNGRDIIGEDVVIIVKKK
jgi:hypothetical protein